MAPDDGFSPAAAEALDLEGAYRIYHEPLMSFLSRRLPERAIAADLAQMVFTSLAARPAISSVRDVRQYLFRAARNQLADYYRREKARHAGAARYAADPALANGEDAPSPEQQAIRRDKLNRLRAIIEAMPQKRRTVFVLARFHELTDTQIAVRLGMRAEAVRQHVSRAMRDCQVEMTRIFDEQPDERHAEKRNGRAAHRR